MKPVPILVLALALVNLAVPGPAIADVGVEKVSRTSGRPGERVELTIGCGACSAAKGQAPASFPISLVPAGKVPVPHPCGPRMLCPPRARAVPKQAPFTYLGEARPPRGGGDAGKPYPLFVLDFAIPMLPAGSYTYVVYCELCLDGRGGSLIADPSVGPRWRLRVGR